MDFERLVGGKGWKAEKGSKAGKGGKADSILAISTLAKQYLISGDGLILGLGGQLGVAMMV